MNEFWEAILHLDFKKHEAIQIITNIAEFYGNNNKNVENTNDTQ